MIAVILSAVIVLGVMPMIAAASDKLPDLNEKSVYYTPDYRSGDCILSSTKSMMRRAAIIRGSDSWDKITNTSIRGSATIRGLLRHSFTYTCDGIKFKIVHHALTGNAEKKKKDIAAFLDGHPEGIVIWGSRAATTGTHGILVTGSKDGKLYAVDSTHNTGRMNNGIEEWEETTMKSIANCTDVWLAGSITGGKGSGPSGPSRLSAIAVREPETITEGKGFTIFGIVTSNYRINNVTVSVVDTAGKEVISKSAAVSGGIYLIAGLDSKVKFGKLRPGSYTYRIAAVDAKKGYTVLHENKFRVIPKKKAYAAVQVSTSHVTIGSVTISSVRAPSSIRKGKAFTVMGKIKASEKIKTVRVKVIGEDGKTVISVSASPKKKSYNILKLDRKIKFGKLEKGTYTYRVRVKTGSSWTTLVDRKFTIE